MEHWERLDSDDLHLPGDLLAVHQRGEDDQAEQGLGYFEVDKSVYWNVSLDNQGVEVWVFLQEGTDGRNQNENGKKEKQGKLF